MSLLEEYAFPFGFVAGALLAAFVVSRLAALVWRRSASGPRLHLLANGSSAAVLGALRLLDDTASGGLDLWATLGLTLGLQVVWLAVDLWRDRGRTDDSAASAWDRVVDPAVRDAGPTETGPPTPPASVPRAVPRRWLAGLGRSVGRHWRGEYPLWIAFWVSGVLAGLVAAVVGGLVEIAGGLWLGSSPYYLAVTLPVIWAVALVTLAWYAVGVWRTAKRSIADRKSLFWARAAKFAVIATVIGKAIDITTIAYPQLVEAGKIALFGDPGIADFTVEVTHDGRAVEVVGGIKHGLARELERALRAAPGVEILRLHSTGGRVGEAERIVALVRRFDLDTYVGQRCVSACTIIFAAGRQRWLARRARLGYHGVAFPGLTADELRDATAAFNAHLLQAGVAPDFVAQAGRVPNASMWYPTTAELLAAGAITSVVADDVLGLRHAGKVSEAEIAEQLRNDSPLYVTMAVVAPGDFTAAVAIVAAGFVERRGDAEISRELRLHVHDLARRYRTRADDATLLAVGAAKIEQLGILRSADRELCYAYARGAADLAAVVDQLPLTRVPQEQALAEQILETTSLGAAVDPNAVAAGRQALRQRLLVLFGQDMLALVERDKLDDFERRRACDVYLGLFQAVLELDRATAAAFLRHDFAER